MKREKQKSVKRYLERGKGIGPFFFETNVKKALDLLARLVAAERKLEFNYYSGKISPPVFSTIEKKADDYYRHKNFFENDYLKLSAEYTKEDPFHITCVWFPGIEHNQSVKDNDFTDAKCIFAVSFQRKDRRSENRSGRRKKVFKYLELDNGEEFEADDFIAGRILNVPGMLENSKYELSVFACVLNRNGRLSVALHPELKNKRNYLWIMDRVLPLLLSDFTSPSNCEDKFPDDLELCFAPASLNLSSLREFAKFKGFLSYLSDEDIPFSEEKLNNAFSIPEFVLTTDRAFDEMIRSISFAMKKKKADFPFVFLLHFLDTWLAGKVAFSFSNEKIFWGNFHIYSSLSRSENTAKTRRAFQVGLSMLSRCIERTTGEVKKVLLPFLDKDYKEKLNEIYACRLENNVVSFYVVHTNNEIARLLFDYYLPQGEKGAQIPSCMWLTD